MVEGDFYMAIPINQRLSSLFTQSIYATVIGNYVSIAGKKTVTIPVILSTNSL